jgi:hypothetical protein
MKFNRTKMGFAFAPLFPTEVQLGHNLDQIEIIADSCPPVHLDVAS